MATNSTNSTELFNAIQKDDQKTVKKLIEEGTFKISLKGTINNNNETAGHIAVQYGNLALLSYLLTKDITLIEVQDKWGQNVLLLAAKKGYVHIIRYLVDELRVDVHLSKYHLKGDTPIHVAAEEGHLNVIKWYCEDFKHVRGNPNLKNSRGETLTMSAVKKSQKHVLEYLLEDGMADPLAIDHQDENVLFHSAVVGDVTIPKYLLEDMAIVYDLDWRNFSGMTVLFVATRFNHLDYVKYFVEQRNATIDLANNMGWTPLHEAACEGHLDLVKYLVEKKADLNRKEMQGRTPAQVAKNKRVIKYLRQAEMEGQNPVDQTEKNRRRRSVSELYVSRLTHPRTPTPCKLIQERINDRFSTCVDQVDSDKASSTLDRFNTPNSNSFLMLAGACASYMSGVSYKQTKNEASLSPSELLRDRVDPIAFSTINAVYNFEYPRMNND